LSARTKEIFFSQGRLLDRNRAEKHKRAWAMAVAWAGPDAATSVAAAKLTAMDADEPLCRTRMSPFSGQQELRFCSTEA
jgi:hypothetical protein